MFTTFLLGKQDPRRDDVETFIRDVYRRQYGALLGAFPPTLIALYGTHGQVLCAAGLRSPEDGFFSECYLDQPIEDALTAYAGHRVERSEIFEVSTLASRHPRAIGRFVFDIINFGNVNNYSWSFFTLTRRLRQMVEYLGVEPALLASADYRRVQNPLVWGSYYAHDPCVFATQRSQLSAAIIDFIEESSHAAAV